MEHNNRETNNDYLLLRKHRTGITYEEKLLL